MKKVFSAALIALLLSAVYGCDSQKPKKSNTSPKPVEQAQTQAQARDIRPPSAPMAADFTATDVVSGKPVSISGLKGKVIILDFWATWCPPCKAEIPFFIELQKQYGKDGLIILGASTDNDPRKVKAFYNSNNMNYPVFMADNKMVMDYGGIQGIPTTFIIDRDGFIRDKYVGFRPKETFEQAFLNLK